MNQAVASRNTEIEVESSGPAIRPVAALSRERSKARTQKTWIRFLRPEVLAGVGLKGIAQVTWHAFQAVNRRLPYGSVKPRWAPAALLKSSERTFPQLGYPRETDSLCPQCVKDVRERIMSGDADWKVLIDGKPGEVKARIVE